MSDPVAAAFTALIRELRTAAIDAPPDSEREAAFHQAARRMAERWAAGEASPVRSAPKKEGV
jgi:hypothetical protein